MNQFSILPSRQSLSRMLIAGVVSLPILAYAACDVETEYSWTTPQPLLSEALSIPGIPDRTSNLANDGAGTWGAIWHQENGEANQVLLGRSFDNADTWEDPIDLRGAEPETSYDPHVGASGSGVWLAAWSIATAEAPIEGGIRIARSTDNAVNWEAPALYPGMPESSYAVSPQVHSGADDVWVLSWIQDASQVPDTTRHLRVARSLDGGVNWEPSTSIALTPEARYSIQTDGNGTWIVVYYADETLTTLAYRRSTDDGMNWSAPVELSFGNEVLWLDLSTDKLGNWALTVAELAVNQARTLQSSDNGVTWEEGGAPFGNNVGAVFTAMDSDEGRMLSLQSSGAADPELGCELRYSTSFDNGVLWTTPTDFATTASGADIETDQKRTWVALFLDTTTPLVSKSMLPLVDADLLVEKSASPDPATVGEPLNYLLTVTNLGQIDATSVTLIDSLPEDVAFVSAETSQGVCLESGGTVLCELGTVSCQSSTSIVIRVTPETSGVVSNSASVASNRLDLTLDNNVTTITTTVIANADLSLTKSDSPDPAVVGVPLTYTIQATNEGPQSALAVEVEDTLQPGVTFNSASSTVGSCVHVAGTVTCSLGTLSSGAVETITIQVTPNTTGTLVNSATVSSTTNDPNLANNTATATTLVNEATADVSVVKTAPGTSSLGSAFAYTIGVSNAGPFPADAVTVTDDLPAEVSFTNATATQGACSETSGVVTCNLGTLSVGGSATITINVTAVTTGTAVNSVSVSSATVDPNNSNNVDSASTVIDLPSGPPDLRGLWVTVVQQCRERRGGLSCRIRGILNIENLGVSSRQNFYVRFYLSNDAVVDSGDLLVLGQMRGRLRTDTVKRLNVNRNLPPTVSGSGKFLIAVIDATGAVTETNEQNNTVVFGPLP